jgi:hypothetical protein
MDNVLHFESELSRGIIEKIDYSHGYITVFPDGGNGTDEITWTGKLEADIGDIVTYRHDYQLIRVERTGCLHSNWRWC